MEEARNASKGRISKDLAHSAVVSLGRGSTVNTVSTRASGGNMSVPQRGAAPPASGQLSNKLTKLRKIDGKQPRRLLPGRAAATLVEMNTLSAASPHKKLQLGQFPRGRSMGHPARQLRVLHNRSKTVNARCDKKQNDSPHEGTPRCDLLPLTCTKIVQAPQVRGRPDRAGPRALGTGNVIPPGNTTFRRGGLQVP